VWICKLDTDSGRFAMHRQRAVDCVFDMFALGEQDQGLIGRMVLGVGIGMLGISKSAGACLTMAGRPKT
jgi:hypothetical protein